MVSAEYKQGSRKSQQSEIFGKEERQAQRARRRAKRTICLDALTRRAQGDRKRATDGRKEANAPLPSASPTPSPKGEGEISIALSTLEKAKTALFAFSPCSGELREERVNLRGVFILNNTQKTAKSHFCRFSLMSIRMGVNVPRVL